MICIRRCTVVVLDLPSTQGTTSLISQLVSIDNLSRTVRLLRMLNTLSVQVFFSPCYLCRRRRRRRRRYLLLLLLRLLLLSPLLFHQNVVKKQRRVDAFEPSAQPGTFYAQIRAKRTATSRIEIFSSNVIFRRGILLFIIIIVIRLFFQPLSLLLLLLLLSILRASISPIFASPSRPGPVGVPTKTRSRRDRIRRHQWLRVSLPKPRAFVSRLLPSSFFLYISRPVTSDVLFFFSWALVLPAPAAPDDDDDANSDLTNDIIMFKPTV